MRRVPVDLVELEAAFDAGPVEGTSYLDLETGEVLFVASAGAAAVAAARARLVAAGRALDGEALARELARDGHPEGAVAWLRRWHELSAVPGRLLAVPADLPGEAYQDMVEYVERAEDLSVRDRLATAIRASGALRRFQDVLADDPAERGRWLAFKSVRQRARLAAWLAAHAIEPVDPGPDAAG